MNYELAKQRDKKGRFVKGHAPTHTTEGVAKFTGENHYGWKGDNASYQAIHMWIRKHWGKPTKCENEECVYPRKNRARVWVMKPKRFEWALKRGRNYSRNRDDYMQLCKSCHAKYDYGLPIGKIA